MKKTLIAVAALSAMAASAMAANVTLYGKIDQGFQVQSKKEGNNDRTTTWKGVSGISSGDFIITTSNKPVEAGKQVRLADNG